MDKLRAIVRRDVRNRVLIAAIIFLIASIGAVSLVFRQPGWPMNHEFTAFSTRTQVYATHLAQGDLFPIWYSGDANGYGTPSTFFYHKTFYYIAATVLLISGSVKLSIALTIVIWLMVGAWGMYLCARLLTRHFSLQVAAPLLFILGNYAFMDWLVRAAMAEFAAYMLIPYVLYWSMILLKRGVFSYWIIPLMIILFFTHNIIALTSLLLLGVAGIAHLFSRIPQDTKKQTLRRLTIAGLISIAIMMPYLTLYKIYTHDYNPASINEENFLPKHQMVSLDRYFIDTHFVWLQDYTKLQLQIDYAVWIPLLVGLIAVMYLVYQRKMEQQTPLYVIVFIICLAIFFFLQTEISLPLYDFLGFLNLLQFPWRLLTFIVPILILLCIYIWSSLASRNRRLRQLLPYGSIILIAITVLSGPITHNFKYTFLGANVFSGGIDQKYMQNMTMGIGEYLPSYVDNTGKSVKSVDKSQVYIEESFYSPSTCSIETQDEHKELKERKFIVRCSENVKSFPLPQNFSRLTKVRDDAGNKVLFFRNPNDPRVLVDARKGTNTYYVSQPRVGDLFDHVLAKIFRS